MEFILRYSRIYEKNALYRQQKFVKFRKKFVKQNYYIIYNQYFML